MLGPAEDLVPHLCSAFLLNSQCQINLDPLVVAVSCFLRPPTLRQVSAEEILVKGPRWFPQRKVHSLKHESLRLNRFANNYPEIFEFDTATSTISLKDHALFVGDAHPCDESWYYIALDRLAHHDADDVNKVIDALEVRLGR